MKTQVNRLKICSFPKILSLKSFGNSWLVRSISGDNFVFYLSTISWLRLQQETMWVNINSERRDLTSTQKRHPTPAELFFWAPEKLEFKLLLPGTVSFSTSYQRWLTRLLISAPPRLCFFPSLICSPTKQPYSKVENLRMFWYRNVVFAFECLFFMLIQI